MLQITVSTAYASSTLKQVCSLTRECYAICNLTAKTLDLLLQVCGMCGQEYVTQPRQGIIMELEALPGFISPRACACIPEDNSW